MRVVLLGKFLNYGGVNEYAGLLAETFQAAGFTVEQVFLRAAREGSASFRSSVPYHAILTGSYARMSIAVGLPLLRLLRTGGYSDSSAPDIGSWALLPVLARLGRCADLIVFTDEVFSIFAQFVEFFSPMPYFVVVHEGYAVKPSSLSGLQLRLLSRARLVLSSSPKAAELTSRRTGLRVVPLVITRPVPKPRLDRSQMILFDTRWTVRRRPDMIIDIARMEPRPTYIVAGSFPDRAQEAAFRTNVDRAGLGNRVLTRTGLTHEEIDELYSRALVYIRWAETDGVNAESGVGIGVVKALQAGCPVIVDQYLGGSALIQHGVQGFVVSPSPRLIASRISELLENPELARRMGDSAWQLSQKLSVAEQAVRLRDLVNQVMPT